MRDLDRANALDGARVFWSQWDGYLQDGPGQKLKQECAARYPAVYTQQTNAGTSVDEGSSAAAPPEGCGRSARQ